MSKELKNEIVGSLTFNVLYAIANQYVNSKVYEFDREELVKLFNNEFSFKARELEKEMDDVWEEAVDNTCYGNAEYWSQEYQALPLATQMIANEPDTRSAVLLKLKELCLA